MTTLTYPSIARNLDTLGEEQKNFESIKVNYIIPGVPFIARLDGKAFHTFTRGLQRPFDTRIHDCMKATMTELCNTYRADLGYSQSDEITLVWFNTDPNKMIFNGRVDKFLSLLSATASVAFYKGVLKNIPEKIDTTPVFDCRVFHVPSRQKVYENVLWRWLDARKNSVSMLASAHFSPKQLLRKSTTDRKQMLLEKGIDWNTFSDDCKYGYFCKRHTFLKKVEDADMHQQYMKSGSLIQVGTDFYCQRSGYQIIENAPRLTVIGDNNPSSETAAWKARVEAIFNEDSIAR